MMGRRRTQRDPTRRRRPRVVKELIRIGSGPAMLYLVAGTDKAVKLLREDVQALEKETGKHIEEMYEEELVKGMQRLDVEAIHLTDDEKDIVRLASKYVLAGYFILSET
ncbi:MAG: hypothetical protein EAX87_08385 [Candidatus Thorarchaeota archaeon]|nr:hypothetical protein [Candidatus Thorarchaeota archaeon]